MKIAASTELDAVLEPTLIFQLNIHKLKEESLLHYIPVHILSVVRSYNNQHEKELLNIYKYVQTLGLLHACHPLDIALLAEAAGKHCFCKNEPKFKVEEFDVSNTLSKELKHPWVNPLKDTPWVATEWDEVIALIITGRQLDVVRLIVEDIEKY